MHIKKPVVDYRELRFSNIRSERFKHVLLLLYWPIFGLFFCYVERFSSVTYYHPMHSVLDDYIPFCEWFLIPYLLWFVFLIGMLLYGFFYDIDAFVNYMRFIIVSYTITMVIYLIYPTCQELRPTEFERDNIFTRFIRGFYNFDTNTNVCPSIHVIGSVAVALSAWHSRKFSTKRWRVVFVVTAFLISVSTVFLKQHSIIDVAAAVPVCLVSWFVTYRKRAPAAELSYR